jgi:hypothetical protein
LQLVFHFCQATAVKDAARNAKTSERTARQTYLELRQRLTGLAFNRWHQNYTFRPDAPLAKSETERAALSEAKGQCLANTTCFRNYRAGNRKGRECSSCPIRDLVASKVSRARHIFQIDLIRQFYEMQGIRGERHLKAGELYHLRYTHWRVLFVAFNNSRLIGNGYMDTDQETFLSGGTLLKTILKELLASPLGSQQTNEHRLRIPGLPQQD